MSNRDIVTGAFGYIGRAIAERRLASGREVGTLTNRSPDATDPLAGRVSVAPLAFDRPAALAAALGGVDTLYATYWIRFPRGELTHDLAVARNLTLFAAARAAGVRRIVHVSITGADLASDLSYFRGKAQIEAALREAGGSYAILRPTVLFGGHDVLINNIAWLLRRLPVFGVAGDGRYRLQPVALEDVARLAVEAAGSDEPLEIDAVGPETFAFADLVARIREAIGARSAIVRMPPTLALAAGAVLNLALRDVLLTGPELRGLMEERLRSDAAPTGVIRFSDWLVAHADELGRRYTNELDRNYR